MNDKLKEQILSLIKSELSISIVVEDDDGYCYNNSKKVTVSLNLGEEEIASESDTFSVEEV